MLRRKISRGQLLHCLANLPVCLIGMEACAGAHHVERQLAALGHDVCLLPAQYVKPFLKGHKNDFRDAEAIAEAVQRPTMRPVPLKTAEQLELQALHRVRSRLIGQRTAVINQIRGFLLECGIPVRQGPAGLREALPAILAQRTEVLSPRMMHLIEDLTEDWRWLDARIEAITKDITALARQDAGCRRLMGIPGVGVITASAMIAAIGTGAAFAKGRDFAAWVGLVPKQISRSTNRRPEARMNIHQNARLTPQGRALIVHRVVQEGWTVSDTAAALGVSERTAYRWLARYRMGGAPALCDRSSAPERCRHRLAPETVAAIARLRRERLTGPAIARQLGMPRSTVGAVLRRLGLGRLAALEPRPPVIRYERQHPGELIHLDIKKLGRIAGIGHRITGDRRGQSNKRGTGWEYLHVAVDDASRLAYTEVLPTETKESATAFLIRALCWFERHGVTVARVMTDNGSCYRSSLFREICAVAEARHIRTRPYTPRTNGKAERFIQTSLREWAYAKPYQSSAERTHAMAPWIASYNYFRPHSALGAKPPIARLNNVLGFDS